ncbi:MAG TPA: lytic transglycosylase domain-containing protein [Terriglobales bacterium]|nr:lytic transglycosylase domain-containing protein [Terriglobales bacterium]
MQRKTFIFLLWIWLAMTVSGAASADIFVYNDPQGVVRFTSAPTEPTFRPYLNGLSTWPRNNWNWRSLRFERVSVGRTDGARRKLFDPIIKEAAQRHKLEVALVKAVIRAESDFVPHAVSPAGALGLMQLMPATARMHKIYRIFEPRQNVEGGTRHLRYLMDRFNGNMRLALAAYNAGEGAVDKYGGIPPYRETQTYVQRVLQYRNRYLTEG